jgi:hypothetical protein
MASRTLSISSVSGACDLARACKRSPVFSPVLYSRQYWMSRFTRFLGMSAGLVGRNWRSPSLYTTSKFTSSSLWHRGAVDSHYEPDISYIITDTRYIPSSGLTLQMLLIYQDSDLLCRFCTGVSDDLCGRFSPVSWDCCFGEITLASRSHWVEQVQVTASDQSRVVRQHSDNNRTGLYRIHWSTV